MRDAVASLVSCIGDIFTVRTQRGYMSIHARNLLWYGPTVRHEDGDAVDDTSWMSLPTLPNYVTFENEIALSN